MFDNISGKIKALAKILTVLGIICCIVIGIMTMIANESFLSGLFVIIIGSLLSWVSSFILYGFGELIEQLEYANSNIYEIYLMLKKPTSEEKKLDPSKMSFASSAPATKKAADGSWICSKCGTKNNVSSSFCKDCGTYR